MASSSTFFGGFLLLGLIGLALGRPLLRADLAAGLSAVTACAIAFGAGRRQSASGERRQRMRARDFLRSLDRTSLVALIAVGTTFGVLAVLLCVGFPRGFEPRAYHLPIGAHFFGTHSLTFWDTERMDTFPANASLYYGFLSSFLPERLVSASNVALLAALLLGLYGLGRTAGDVSSSVLASCGAATIPMVSFSVLEAGADIGGIAFLAAAVYFALAPEPLGRSDLVLAGLAAGVAFGFKSLHLVSVAFLAALVFWRLAHETRNPSALGRLRGAAFGSIVFLAGLFATAGGWLLRSWSILGNPLYPVHLGAAVGRARLDTGARTSTF